MLVFGRGRRGLTETETELVTRRDGGFVEVAVVDVEAFGEVVVAGDDAGAVIAGGFGDGVGELSGGGGRAVEDVDQAVSALLAGDAGPNNGDDVGEGEDGFHDHRTDAVDDDNGLLVHGCDGADESVARMPGVEIIAVAGVAFDCDVTLARVGVDEDDSGCRRRSCRCTSASAVCGRCSDGSAVLCRLSLDSIKRSN